MKLHQNILVPAALMLISLTAQAVEYPDGYRHWTHIKTLILHAGHPLDNPFEGIHHIYANQEGLQGLQSGQYADGSVLVFDLLENITRDHASAEGERVLVGVMKKDRKKDAATGDWGFEAWSGNSRTERIVKDGGQSCFACHTSEEKNGYVFSRWRE